ncbi:MAG: hypothetical protein BWY85_01258 [Firmicutes bacterium ADurb.Bin506]|nr:MAG: hypothetical protein BWY85_01258 [Firmicutes bacterium ADurb.Bin506]
MRAPTGAEVEILHFDDAYVLHPVGGLAQPGSVEGCGVPELRFHAAVLEYYFACEAFDGSQLVGADLSGVQVDGDVFVAQMEAYGFEAEEPRERGRQNVLA